MKFYSGLKYKWSIVLCEITCGNAPWLNAYTIHTSYVTCTM